MLEKDHRLRPTAAEVDEALAELPVERARARPAGLRSPAWSAARRSWTNCSRRSGRPRRAAGLFLCVTGEPGIGKTTLVEDFLAELAAAGRTCTVARGRCSERLAGAEAYLPFLEALESLLRGARRRGGRPA